jgi:hypothetical protein
MTPSAPASAWIVPPADHGSPRRSTQELCERPLGLAYTLMDVRTVTDEPDQADGRQIKRSVQKERNCETPCRAAHLTDPIHPYRSGQPRRWGKPERPLQSVVLTR